MSDVALGPGEASLVEVVVHVAPEHAVDAELAIGAFSPGGFGQEELEDGGARFTVYLPTGDEARLESWLAGEGVPLFGAADVRVVPADWSERWKAFHQPVVVGGLWVGPPWQVDEAPAGMRRVVIEPAQGFGTGAHPTTRLVLGLLAEQPRASVLDVGCGSGVLSAAASMLGFGPITAIDNDPVAVESTRDNLVRNGVRGVDVRVLDALQQDLPKADVVLANVILEPLLRMAPRMTAPRLVLSGLLRSQVEECSAAYEAVGYVVRERRDRDGWSAIVLDDARPDAAAMQYRAAW
ncbi:MAG: ribosomal protein methyltransferase [Thermoleophilia bacterium]|nr:ribosomal protein methyltransferase [Thermoleophilia bacterium]